MKKTLVIGASVLALGLGLVPAAQAASLPTYASLDECNRDVGARNTAVSSPINNDYFSCKQVGSVPNGVAGCPPTTPSQDGCIGTFYQVVENRN